MNKEERAKHEAEKKRLRQLRDKDLMVQYHRESCDECQEREGLCTEGEVLLNYDPSNIN